MLSYHIAFTISAWAWRASAVLRCTSSSRVWIWFRIIRFFFFTISASALNSSVCWFVCAIWSFMACDRASSCLFVLSDSVYCSSRPAKRTESVWHNSASLLRSSRVFSSLCLRRLSRSLQAVRRHGSILTGFPDSSTTADNLAGSNALAASVRFLAAIFAASILSLSCKIWCGNWVSVFKMDNMIFTTAS